MDLNHQHIATEIPGPPKTGDPVDLIADTIGQMMEYWGFKHIMGRLWATLFLSSKALSAPELVERLGVSSGAISMALRDLLTWGAVRKVCPRDSRKDHFVAENDIWKLVSRVLSLRELRRVDLALNNMEQALNTLQKEKADSEAKEVQYQIQRLEELRKLGKLGKKILKVLLMRAKVDVTPLQDFFDSPSGTQSSDQNSERILS